MYLILQKLSLCSILMTKCRRLTDYAGLTKTLKILNKRSEVSTHFRLLVCEILRLEKTLKFEEKRTTDRKIALLVCLNIICLNGVQRHFNTNRSFCTRHEKLTKTKGHQNMHAYLTLSYYVSVITTTNLNPT